MRVLYTQCTFNIYSAFFFVHFIYPLHSTCSWIILSTANIVICIRSFLLLFSVKTSCNLTFFRAFFCLKLLTPSSNLVISLSQLTYSYEALSVALIKDRSLFIRISWSRRFKFLSFVSFHSSRLFLLSYSPSFEIGSYTGALCHRPRRFSCIFPICLRSFSFLFAIGFATGLPFPW